MAKRIRKNGTAMMGRWPVLKYNEIGDIMCLEHRNHLNGVVVDDAALEVMLRIEKTMQRLEALCDEGVGVVCDEMARLLRIAEETDWVGITPGANKYSYDENVGNEITLPFVDGDITAEQIAEVIAATEWEKVRKVRVRRDCEKGTNNKQEEI